MRRKLGEHSFILVALALLATSCSKEDSGSPAEPTGPRNPNEIHCAAGLVPCGQECLDVVADPMNCGGCGIPCSTGQTCQSGVCQCAPGSLDCSGAAETTGTAGTTGTTGMAGDMPTLVTSAPDAYWKTDGQLTDVATGNADVTVDDSSTAQVWEGFGGSFNEMGWNYLSMLGQADRDRAINLLYGADGARFAFGRIPIGATDYAMSRYTLDETADDISLADFSIDRDKDKLIPYVKAALAVKGNIRLWASPWTPPTWMKQGPFNDDSAFDGGTMKDDDATLNAFAQYLIKFVQAYRQEGINIEVISPQNEPGYSGTYPTCGWAPATYAKFIGDYLGPAIASAGIGTKIMLGTFNGGSGDTDIVGSVLGDAGARSYIKVFGYQWGMQSSVANATSYNLPVWQTEHQCGNYPWMQPFNASVAPNDQAYAVESWGLIRDWIKAGVTAYNAWNMVLDTVGVGIDSKRVWPQDSLLLVDTSAKSLIVTPAYYVFRHFSQFITPGAKVVATSGGDAVAFKNPDGSIVAVMYNSGTAKTTTVAIAGKKLQFAMPGNGWATIVSG